MVSFIRRIFIRLKFCGDVSKRFVVCEAYSNVHTKSLFILEKPNDCIKKILKAFQSKPNEFHFICVVKRFPFCFSPFFGEFIRWKSDLYIVFTLQPFCYLSLSVSLHLRSVQICFAGKDGRLNTIHPGVCRAPAHKKCEPNENRF